MNNRRIVLASRPTGMPTAANFRTEEAPVPALSNEQVLLKTIYLSIDPYMRGRMSDAPSYVPPVQIGEVMCGGTVAEVVESKAADFHAGDIVVSYSGWQEYAVANAKDVQKVDAKLAPLSYWLGVLGMPGLTAYTGLLNIGKPKAGETVVVAAAAGAVGSVVGQIAKIHGARAVGIAGGKQKCDYVVNELGFDACIDHRSPTFAQELKAACPKGIDVYFENVGGDVLKAVWPRLNPFARVPVCGLIAHYNATELPSGPDMSPLMMRDILVKRLTVRGFIFFDFIQQQLEFIAAMLGWLESGKVKYREDIVEGLDQAVPALLGVLQGKNFGKQLVRISSDPV